MEIIRYMHFVDNTTLLPRTDPNYDKLGKIRPIVDHLSHQFLTVYNPHRETSIDEEMVAFKGRSSMKQYVPKRPSRGASRCGLGRTLCQAMWASSRSTLVKYLESASSAWEGTWSTWYRTVTTADASRWPHQLTKELWQYDIHRIVKHKYTYTENNHKTYRWE